MVKAPRSGQEAVAGISWLARMIDKSRLTETEKVELDLDYPCPMDMRLLNKLGLDGKAFQNITQNNPSDDAIITALEKAGAKLTAAQAG
jgi:hypothetical protein